MRKRRKRVREKRTQVQSKMAMNKYLSIITLNVSGLNDPIKEKGN